MRKWLTNRLASLVALLERPRDETGSVSPLTQRIKQLEDERSKDAAYIKSLEEDLERAKKVVAYVLVLEGDVARANKLADNARKNEGLLAARIGRLQTENPEVHKLYFTVNNPPRGR